MSNQDEHYNLLLQAALNHGSSGRPVFPLIGKRPAMAMGEKFSNATINSTIIQAWWEGKYAGYNIGVPTGPASGFWALDVDCKLDANGLDSLVQLQRSHGELPHTVKQRTGTGFHLLFKYEHPITNSAGKIAPGLDVRGEGGYIVVPPSVHPETGNHYQWEDGASLFEREIASAPDWLVQLAMKTPTTLEAAVHQVTAEHSDTHYSRAALESECQKIEGAPNGVQERVLNDSSFAIGQLVAADQIHYQHAFDRLLASAKRMPSYDSQNPWTDQQLIQKISRGLGNGMERPRRSVIPSPVTGAAPANLIADMNEKYAAVRVGSKFAVMCLELSPIDGIP